MSDEDALLAAASGNGLDNLGSYSREFSTEYRSSAIPTHQPRSLSRRILKLLCPQFNLSSYLLHQVPITNCTARV